jgi:hypothetical protein
LEYQSQKGEEPGIESKKIYIKMESELDKEQIKKIIKEELDDMIGHYSVNIEDIEVDLNTQRVNVTFGLSTVNDDNYIGLCFY